MRLIDELGARILSNDIVSANSNGIVTLENTLIRIIFNIPEKTIQIYGFYYGWVFIGSLYVKNMYNIKPSQYRL